LTGETDGPCGNGVVDTLEGEECEDGVLGVATCETQGFAEGTLACDSLCRYDDSECVPSAPVLSLEISATKKFDFAWDLDPAVAYYHLEESAAPSEPFIQTGESLQGSAVSLIVPLHLRAQARYRLRACGSGGACSVSQILDVTGSLAEAVGYFKASNTAPVDRFGFSMALSADGKTLVVGTPYLSNNRTANGAPVATNAIFAGAVYVFSLSEDAWRQQAFLKASNSDANFWFGSSVTLSEDGNTLAVGAPGESSGATGINGDQENNDAFDSGAVYIFHRDDDAGWHQQSYIKASNSEEGDYFGRGVALSDDGATLAVGADQEDSATTSVNGAQSNNDAISSGAA